MPQRIQKCQLLQLQNNTEFLKRDYLDQLKGKHAIKKIVHHCFLQPIQSKSSKKHNWGTGDMNNGSA